MAQGAGILIGCRSTGNVLLLLRNDNPIAWANFGGMLQRPESAIQCAKRETFEESGFLESKDYVLAFKHPIDINVFSKFKYSCYLGISETEIVPKLNYEHSKHQWFSLDSLPHNIHFGISNTLSKQSVLMSVKKNLGIA